MKQTFLIALPLLIIATILSAQPQISYIIPDIGTPGMNSYVEIVAPVTATGAFGTEGMSATAAVTVEFVDPADSSFIVVSPVVVGWEGRLISCQFFVKPYAPLRPYPFRVRVNNQRSNVDTFFVEAPQTFGSKNGGGVIGSGGAWGRRSKRGAMIVDSITLGPGLYTIDTQTDPDPGTAGHQGFLPAVILSKGPVRINVGATLSASANGKNGGPGGGGGGGYGSGVPPLIPGERNTPLGNGFAGGKSNIPIISSPASSFGQGSGTGSASLNGVEANSSFTTTFPTLARLYGAGPGHPFDSDGRSGGAAAATGGSALAAFGTYYGGGGNATSGGGLPAAQSDMNGQVVGNKEIVPLHGGGAGSSGGPGDSVGAGGGGGVAIYSQLGTVVRGIQSNGANGANGCNACGLGSGDASGGGAGGSIVVGGKLGVQVGSVEVNGGRAGITQPSAPVASTSGSGGAGRFRHDGRIGGNIASVTAGASRSVGPTIDTLTVVTSPIFTVKGTGSYAAGRGANIQVFVRGESLQWNYSSPYNAVVRPDSTWQVEVAITTNDPLLYVFAVQLTDPAERTGTNEWTRIPTHIFSQGAANIVRYVPAPQLNVPTDVWLDTILCLGETVTGKLPLYNAGAAPLYIDNPTSFSWPSSQNFRITNATDLPMTIPPGARDTLHLTFSGGIPGDNVGELEIYTNETDPTRRIRKVRVHAFNAYRAYLNPDPMRPPTIDFGDVRVNSSMDRRAVIRNVDEIVSTNLLVDSLWVSPPTVSIVTISRSIPNEVPIGPGDSLVVELRYSPTQEETLGPVSLCARLKEPCADQICWPLTGKGVQSSLLLSEPSMSMVVPACSARAPVHDTVAYTNTGSTTIEISSMTILPTGPGPFTIVRPATPFPITLVPGEERKIIVSYTPDANPRATAMLEILTSDPDIPKHELLLSGAWDTAAVELSTHNVGLFGNTLGVQVDSVVRIRNTGTVECTVHLRRSGGTDPFIISPLPQDYVIPAGDEVAVTLSYTPMIADIVSTTMYVTVEPCGLIDSFLVAGGFQACEIIIEPQPLAFGDIRVGSITQRVASLTNNSTSAVQVLSAQIVPAIPELVVSPSQTFPINLAPSGGTGTVSLTYAPTAAGGLPPGTRLELTLGPPCENMVLITEVTGQGVPGTLEVDPNPIDFGEVYSCLEERDTIRLYNRSSAPVTILGLQVDPTPGEFTAVLADPSRPNPQLSPDQGVDVIVTFAPVAPADGPKSAIMKVFTNDPNIGTFEAPLSGTRVSESLTLTGPPFALTLAGLKDVRRRFIVNDGPTPIAINNLNVPPPFRVVQTIPTLSALLLPGDTLIVDLEFAPPAEGIYEDSIEVEGLTICGLLHLPISGESPAAFTADAYWDGITGKPGETILLPLVLTVDVTDAAITQYDIDARFNATMLLPRRVVLNGTMSDDWVVTGERFDTGSVSFRATGSEPLAGTGTLAYVEMIVLLGNDLTTTIESDSSRFLTGGARLAIAPGLFTLNGYCTVGGNRLVRITDNFGIKAVAPNPARDRIGIDFELVEDGQTRLTLYDMLGRQVAVLLDAEMKAQPHRLETSLELPDGIYFLELTTPTQKEQKGIVIGK